MVFTERAPAPVGPYSQAVKLENDLLFVSGQIGLVPGTGELAEGGEEQARRCLENIREILSAAGGTMASILTTTVFLADIEDYPRVNEVYAEFFPEDPPARSCVAVAALPRGARVEIECIARV